LPENKSFFRILAGCTELYLIFKKKSASFGHRGGKAYFLRKARRIKKRWKRKIPIIPDCLK